MLLASLAFGYPFLVRVGSALGRPRLIVVLMAMALLAPAAVVWQRGRSSDALRHLAEAAVAIAFLVAAAVVNDAHLYRLGPALTNVGLLLAFGRTVLRGPSMAETFARMRRRDLPCEAVIYCRRLTIIWCVFFSVNTGVIVWFAFYASIELWTIYTGGVAYLLAGTFFIAELLYRQRRFADVLQPGRS
jgi:uncharacterized membrane protein